MRNLTLAEATATGIAIGGILLNATPARADLPTIDATVLAAVNAVKSASPRSTATFRTSKAF